MAQQLSREKFDELYRKLPEDLRDAYFAQETGEKIEGICRRNKMEDLEEFMINGIADLYLGLLSPNDFFAALKKQLKGKTGVKQIVYEINTFLLFPYKTSIEQIYHLQCAPEAAAAAPAGTAPAAATPTTTAPAATTAATPAAADQNPPAA